jgi:tryptophan synthase alpha subunit
MTTHTIPENIANALATSAGVIVGSVFIIVVIADATNNETVAIY